jgi:hypothetical protein
MLKCCSASRDAWPKRWLNEPRPDAADLIEDAVEARAALLVAR